MVGRLQCAFAVAAVSLAAPSLAQEPPCSATAVVVPSRAVVSQPVAYRVRIRSRDDVRTVEWIEQPAFANVRTEVLPGSPQPAGPGDAGYRVREEVRVIFPERTGPLRLRSAGLRCTLRDGRVLVAPVAELRLDVEPFPEDGRPASFDGLVGPVALTLTVVPRAVSLGQSVRVALVVRGAGNLWDVRAPFGPQAFGDAEVFPRPAQVVLDRGKALYVRKHFAFDVVPRAEGRLHVPAVALDSWDPESGSYGRAVTEPVDVTVGPRPLSSPEPTAAASPKRRAGSPPPASRLRFWAIAAAALVTTAGASWLIVRRRARPDPRGALEEAAAAREAGEPEAEAFALSRALRLALSAHVADALSLAPEELSSRPGLAPAVAAAAHLLAALERCRFDPEAPPADAAAVRRAVQALN